MKIKTIFTIAILISSSLMAAHFSPGIDREQFREGKYIHLDQMVIEFDRSDAEVSIYYHLSPFAQVYMFLFGSKYLEPKIEEIFFDFNDTSIEEIGRTSAKIRINNISRLSSDNNYLHDSKKLGMQTSILTLVYPTGKTMRIEKATTTPNTFYDYKHLL
jgi:hypothetical protein